MKDVVHSPDSNSDYFKIVTRVLLENTLAPILVIICLDYVQQTSIDLMKDNGLTPLKKRHQPKYYKTWLSW